MRLEEMTDDQKAALTDADVTKLADLRCAEQGIPLVLDPEPDDKPTVLPDRVAYRVCGVLFAERTEAETVALTVQGMRRLGQKYDYRSYASTNECEPDESEIKIESYPYFSNEVAHKQRAEIDAQRRRMAIAERAREVNNKRLRDRGEIVSSIWKEVWAAQERVKDQQRLGTLWAKYLDIAEGDAEKARKFLIMAEKLPDDWQPATN